MLATATFAQPAPPPGAPPGGPAASGPKPDMSVAFNEIDTNKDGVIDKTEWFAAGLSQISYDGLFKNMLDSNKDGKITLAEFTASTPMFEIDLNKDGKVRPAGHIRYAVSSAAYGRALK
jgi:hypothetical protein